MVGQRIPITFADHTDASGIALFERASKLDLEGIVATHKLSPYAPASATTRFKIRNRNYSQWIGREKLFERDRHQEPVAGWHTCALASAAVDGM